MNSFAYPFRFSLDTKNNYRELEEPLFFAAMSELVHFCPMARNSTEDNPIQILDFFSGAGGTSLGFAAINAVAPLFRFLGGCDIDEYSAASYAMNFGTKEICADITDIAKSADSIDAFLERVGYRDNQMSIFIGCAPCQGFTSHRKRHWQEQDDARNVLATAFSRIVSRAKPTAFLMENVPEFLSEKYESYYKSAISILENAGYIIKQAIYCSADYGVPQERYRAIIIGLKRDFPLPVEYFDKSSYKTVRDAISQLPALKAGQKSESDPLHRAVNHKASTIETIKQVPHDGGSLPPGVGPDCLKRVKGFYDVYGRLKWDEPSITITHYARNPASGRFTHPEQDRGLTAREAARLQSFPDGFLFSGKSDDIYRQIGEAVPPLLACGIASQLVLEMISRPPTLDQIAAGKKPIETPVSNSFSSVISGLKMKKRTNA